MDKFTFEGVDHSWTKLCYYYKNLSQPASVEEKLAELDAMVSGATVKDEEIKAQIDKIYENAKASLEGYTVVSVERAVIDSAMTQIYKLIQIDEAQSK